MIETILVWASAAWLGILTSISPCPLAANITAISFVARHADRPGAVLASGALYTLGRATTYVVIGALLVAGLVAAPGLSLVLQRAMNKLLGPILIVVGLVLLDLIRIRPRRTTGFGTGWQPRIERMGLLGAWLLGVLFAVAFCPVSATLFFGSLIPLAVAERSSIVVPLAYGIGTALPVMAVAIALAVGVQAAATLFGRLQSIERWARRVTGAVFIGVGFYFSLAYVYLA
ncbi:sulfite exporter TauE/SafE family protein [Candidatus Bipolaricaulota bacterium]|nr:sulfite exporter TauE/SafE family protein [Candidatus Bipolaricaulota bacterium]